MQSPRPEGLSACPPRAAISGGKSLPRRPIYGPGNARVPVARGRSSDQIQNGMTQEEFQTVVPVNIEGSNDEPSLPGMRNPALPPNNEVAARVSSRVSGGRITRAVLAAASITCVGAGKTPHVYNPKRAAPSRGEVSLSRRLVQMRDRLFDGNREKSIECSTRPQVVVDPTVAVAFVAWKEPGNGDS